MGAYFRASLYLFGGGGKGRECGQLDNSSLGNEVLEITRISVLLWWVVWIARLISRHAGKGGKKGSDMKKNSL